MQFITIRYFTCYFSYIFTALRELLCKCGIKCLWKLTFSKESCIMHRGEYLLKFRFGWCGPSAFRARSIDKERSRSELLEDRLFGKNNAIYVAGNSQNSLAGTIVFANELIVNLHLSHMKQNIDWNTIVQQRDSLLLFPRLPSTLFRNIIQTKSVNISLTQATFLYSKRVISFEGKFEIYSKRKS